jgi:hypothetical protein
MEDKHRHDPSQNPQIVYNSLLPIQIWEINFTYQRTNGLPIASSKCEVLPRI